MRRVRALIEMHRVRALIEMHHVRAFSGSSTALDAAHAAVDAAVDAAHATVDAAHAGRYGLQSASMAASVCFALGRALLD